MAGANTQKNSMLPRMCSQPACMNMAVRMVMRLCPATMSAGTSDHWLMKASPPASSKKNTMKLMTMMVTVAMGKRTGRREASLSGIMVNLLPVNLAQSAFKETLARRALGQRGGQPARNGFRLARRRLGRGRAAGRLLGAGQVRQQRPELARQVELGGGLHGAPQPLGRQVGLAVKQVQRGRGAGVVQAGARVVADEDAPLGHVAMSALHLARAQQRFRLQPQC